MSCARGGHTEKIRKESMDETVEKWCDRVRNLDFILYSMMANQLAGSLQKQNNIITFVL